MEIYPRNYFIMRIIPIQHLASYDLFLLSIKNLYSWNKLHAILRFPTGSFEVDTGDHLFSNLGDHFGSGDHLGCCTDALWSMALMGHSNNFFYLFFFFKSFCIFIYIF